MNPEIYEQRKKVNYYLKYITPWTDDFRKALLLHFKVSPNGELIRDGKAVGTLNKGGYLVTGFGVKTYLVHRLIYFMAHGSIPKVVDHINRDRKDNRIENLRSATTGENGCNRNIKENGLPLGVYSHTRKGREGIWWSAKIEKNGKQYGTTTRYKEKAILWRLQKEKELFGEFQNEDNKKRMDK